MSVTLLNRAVDAAVARRRITPADVEQFARAVKGGGGVAPDELAAFQAIATRHADRFDVEARAQHAALLASFAQLPAPPPPVKATTPAPAPAPAPAAPAVVSWDDFTVAARPQDVTGPMRAEAQEVMALLTAAVARGVLPKGDDLLLTSAVAQVGFGTVAARSTVERLEGLGGEERAAFSSLTRTVDSPLKRAVLYAAFSAGSPLGALGTLARSLSGLTDARVQQVLTARGNEQLALTTEARPLEAGEVAARSAGPLSRLDVTAKQQLTAVLDSEGFNALGANEQTRLLALLGGTNRLISGPARAVFAQLVKQDAFVMVSGETQAAALRTALREEAWLSPNIGDVVDLSGRPRVTLRDPVAVAAHVFVAAEGQVAKRELPAMRYDLELDGRLVPLFFAVSEPVPGEVRQSALTVAQALAALPKPNRDLVQAINLHAESNPHDAAWRRIFELPDFRTLMTTGEGGVIHVYPVAEVGGTSEHQLLPALIHETGHVVSRDAWGRVNDARWFPWKAAAAADGVSASKYARENWEEDFSETLTLLERVRGTPAEAEVRAMMPARMELLDGLWA